MKKSLDGRHGISLERARAWTSSPPRRLPSTRIAGSTPPRSAGRTRRARRHRWPPARSTASWPCSDTCSDWRTRSGAPSEPYRKIRLEKEPEGRIRWLEPDEERVLLAACLASKTPDLLPIVIMAMETGMRYGEIMGLTWERVDLSRGVLRLEGRDRRTGGRTKSAKWRDVPMRQPVYNLLAARPGPRTGRVWPDRSIRTAFENAVKAAGLEDSFFHDLRHRFASRFMMRGGSLQALQRILGACLAGDDRAVRSPVA